VDGYISYVEARAAQPDSLAQAITRLSKGVTEARDSGKLHGPGPVFLGIGASLAAASAAVWVLRERGIDAWRLGAGDTPLPLPSADRVYVGVSQSGRSTETITALDAVDQKRRLAVVNVHPSPLSALVESTIGLGNIPDSYASTIGYTATVVALGMVAEAWDDGEVDQSWHTFAEVFGALESARDAELDTAAEYFIDASAADFVGNGASLGSAEAGALLFREIARIASSSMGTRQYLHGAMESASEFSVHIVLGDDREHELARMLSAAGHRVVLITASAFDARPNVTVISLPESSATQRPALEALIMQSLVERVAALRGIEIEEFVFHNDDTKVAGTGTTV
jgi:fructoselysine-6-P-deglycase FrlB-like protein